MRGWNMDTLKALDDAPLIPVDLDPGEDIYALFARLRPETPIVRTPMGVTVALHARHIDLVTSDRTRQLETETKVMQGIFEGPIMDFTRLAMLFANGEVHMRRRTPVARTFAFKLMDAMRPKIRDIATEMVTTRLNEGPVDFVGEIASQLPARIIADILGIPRTDIPVFLKWIQDTAAAIGLVPYEERETIERSLVEFNAYVEALLDERRRTPREDFLSDYVRATAEAGNLDEGEIRTQILGLILAGSDTTRGSLCMTLSELLQHPDQWQALVADPDGMKKAAVDEGLRYQPVIFSIPRVATRDFEIDGYMIPEGAVIAVSIVSALRDPAVYSDPETFNIHRTDHTRWHFIFGAGAHRCVGEALARAEMEETLALIAALAPATRLVGSPPTLDFGAIRQVGPMQVAFA